MIHLLVETSFVFDILNAFSNGEIGVPYISVFSIACLHEEKSFLPRDFIELTDCVEVASDVDGRSKIDHVLFSATCW